MRKFIIALGAIIILAGAGFGAYTYVQNQNYEHTLKAAKNAVKNEDWSKAKQKYQQAQTIKMTPETQTAKTQLGHAVKAQQASEKNEWHLAQSQYTAALNVDDGLPYINSELKQALKRTNKKQAHDEKKHKAEKAHKRAVSESIERAASESYSIQDSMEASSKKQASRDKAKAKHKAKAAHGHKNDSETKTSKNLNADN